MTDRTLEDKLLKILEDAPDGLSGFQLAYALAAQARAGLAPKVRGLIWSGDGFAHNDLGTTYQVTGYPPELVLYRHEGSSKTGLGVSEYVSELHEIADKDNERRILSALTTAPVTPQQAAEVLLADQAQLFAEHFSGDADGEFAFYAAEAALRAIAEDGE